MQANATENNNHAKLDVKDLLKPAPIEKVLATTPFKDKHQTAAGLASLSTGVEVGAKSSLGAQQANVEANAELSDLSVADIEEVIFHELTAVQTAILAEKVGDILKSLDAQSLKKISKQFNLKAGAEHAFDYAQVLPLLDALSQLPNDKALTYLGDLYKFGHGIPQNQSQAFVCYEKAALLGNTVAMNSLGECFSYGVGCEVSLETAAKWYLEAANKGNVEAQFNLGYVYEFGEGVPLDPTQARFWYEKAAAQQHAESMFFLGQMYLDGDGVPFDELIAKDYFGRACDLGSTDSCNLYQVMLSNNQQ